MMWHSAIIPGFALVAGMGMAQVDPFAFMPDGGRVSLERAYPNLENRNAALTEARSAEEWRAALAASGLTEPEAATLAAYLSRVAPWQAVGDATDGLPRDGRDLALAQCQS